MGGEQTGEGAGAVPRRLFVLRHADAAVSPRGASDATRPLSARGRRSLPELQERIAERGADIRVVLCSAAVRAAATLEGVRSALPREARIEVTNELYLAGGDELLERCRALDPAVPAALVIGHNPGVAALVHELAEQHLPVIRDELARGFPPGTLAELAVPVAWERLAWSSCQLVGLRRPGRRGS